jgi:hypothetical protein
MQVIDDQIFVIENFISPNTAKYIVDTFTPYVNKSEYAGTYRGPGKGEQDAFRLSGLYKIDQYDGNNDVGIDLLTGICNNMEKTMSDIFNKHIIMKSIFYSHMVTGGKNSLHVDNRKEEYKHDFSGILYLTDEYTGGDLYFPNKNLKFHAKPGTFICFIGTEDLAHEVQEVIDGNRINLICFFNERNHFANLRV